MRARVRASVDAGLRVPGIAVRAAVLLMGALALLLVPPPFSVVALVLAAVAAAFPASMAGVPCAVLIGLAQLTRPAAVLDWHPYAALAAVHLLFMLSALCLVVGASGSLQLRALLRPLGRFAMIQLPAQAALALVLFVGQSGAQGLAGRALAVIAAVAVAGAALLVVRRT